MQKNEQNAGNEAFQTARKSSFLFKNTFPASVITSWKSLRRLFKFTLWRFTYKNGYTEKETVD